MSEQPSHYRARGREPRREVIRFSASALRIVFLFFGVLLVVPMLIAWLTIDPQRVRFTCTRDTSGAGKCEHSVRYVVRETRETYDVRDLESARAVSQPTKGGLAYRVYVVVRGADVPLGEPSRDADQVGVAERINRFARDKTLRAVDESYEGQFTVSTVLTFLFVAGGVCFLVAALRRGGRRLVLEEESGIATLEEHRALSWKKVWSVPLRDIAVARVDGDTRTPRIVVDTKDDGALVLQDYVKADDASLAALSRFLKGD